MNLDTQTWSILVGVVIVAFIAIAVWRVYQKRQSKRLKQRFGPEYTRALGDLGSRTKAESELKAREDRVEHLNIVPLSAPEAARFSEAWKALQGRFVDNPKGVLIEANQLVRQLMLKRGYPVADFARRAADISVDHPMVVEHYRAAEATALRDQRGEADTEELRQGVVHFRALFDELLEVSEPVQVPTRPVAIQA
jgi:hypothetical protein